MKLQKYNSLYLKVKLVAFKTQTSVIIIYNYLLFYNRKCILIVYIQIHITYIYVAYICGLYDAVSFFPLINSAYNFNLYIFAQNNCS